MRLISNQSEMMSKCGKKKKKKPSASPHLHVFCDLFINRLMATWNLFVSYSRINDNVVYASLPQSIISKDQSKGMHDSAHYISYHSTSDQAETKKKLYSHLHHCQTWKKKKKTF